MTCKPILFFCFCFCFFFVFLYFLLLIFNFLTILFLYSVTSFNFKIYTFFFSFKVTCSRPICVSYCDLHASFYGLELLFCLIASNLTLKLNNPRSILWLLHVNPISGLPCILLSLLPPNSRSHYPSPRHHHSVAIAGQSCVHFRESEFDPYD